MRIQPLPPDRADAATRSRYDAVRAALGAVPNLFQVLGVAPAALDAYLAFSGALAKGSLSAGTRERVALAVAEANTCAYCLAAHTALGRKAGLNDSEMQRARQGTSEDVLAAGAVALALALVRSRGRVSDGDLGEARRAGLSDAAIVEVVGAVALNVFTNYLNQVADTAVDFPAAPAIASAAH